jgi:hypothetical protein
MGNNDTRSVTFRQSAHDFPLTVSLGEKVPAWGLSRWGGSGLRFIPPDDEGFILRGDRRQLVYKGRRRSHRFTILGDTSFEYDCILEKEPENNVITLLMEGAERFDFFRQPDFVKDPFLKGSYAVYKKETLMGEGTGKLCHIHRPLVMDSRGRRCWGDLSVRGNELRISIPETWLTNAKYPVIVDPVIGSSAAGAYHFFYYIYDSEYEEYLEDWKRAGDSDAEIAEYLEEWTVMPSACHTLLFTRWTTPEPLQGPCTVFFHVAELNYGDYNVFAPVLFTEFQHIPDTRISSEEYGWLGTRGSSPLGWNSVAFTIQNAVAANSPLWLGLIATGIGISFDYGAEYFDILGNLNTVSAKTRITNGQPVGDLLNGVGDYIPYYREMAAYGDEAWIEEMRPSVHYLKHNAHPKMAGRYDFKFSYYFQPVRMAYSRTLTAGVTLTDSRKQAGGYKRTAVETVGGAGDTVRRFLSILRKAAQRAGAGSETQRISQAKRVIADTGKAGTGISRKEDFKRSAVQTVRGTTAVTRLEGFYRSIVQTAKSTMTVKASPTLIRKLIQQAGTSDTAKRFLSVLRRPTQTAGVNSETQRISQAKRSIADTGKPGTAINKKQDFRRNIAHRGNAGTAVLKRAEYVKRFEETAGSTGNAGAVRKLVLRIVEAVAALYEMKAGTSFSRSVRDTVKNSSVMGGMVAFFRILSGYAGSGDSTGSFIARMRVIQDRGTVGDDLGHTADYLRGLFVEAGTIAETKHRAEYHRKQQDTAHSEAVPLRHLFIFIRLLTGAYIRDYIIGRFLEGIISAVIKYRKPDGSAGELPAGVGDMAKGVIFHECIEGDIDRAGWWVFWAFITFADGRTAAGEAAKVFVWHEGFG